MAGSVQAKADRYNAGKNAAVYAWIRGNYAPDAAKRMRIHDDGGPEPAWWDEPAPGGEAKAIGAPSVAAGAATPGAIASEADKLLADVQAHREYVSALEGGDPGEKLSHLERLAKMLGVLSKMRGVMMNERQILGSPHWLNVEAALTKALTPWPDAMRAVADALEALRGAS